MLRPAHIHARARRYAVRMFLSHLHQVWYEIEYGRPAPRPYAVEHLGHVHVIKPPNWPLQNKAATLTVTEEQNIINEIIRDNNGNIEENLDDVVMGNSSIPQIAPQHENLATKLARFKEGLERNRN